jgi:hypothetical protein
MRANTRVLGKSRVETGHIAQATAITPDADDDETIDEKPKSVYEVVTRQMLEQVKADVSEVKSRVNTLIWLVIGAMMIELVMRVVK